MSDIIIFGFGLAVSALIGVGLSTMIVIKNRALDAADKTVGPTDEASAKNATGRV